MSLTISKVEISELEPLRELAERTFREAWQDDNEPEAFETYCREHFSLERLAAELAHAGSEFYLAYLENEPLAYLKLNLHRTPAHDWDGYPDALQLERIYVRQDIQSRGLGAELLRFTEERTRAAGLDWIWLSVWQKSPRSVAFYKRHDFEIFGVETFWVADDPQPDWLMRKKVID